ncbi:MAG: polyprenyl synthetase family protein [Bacteroidales bacterium]
MAKHKCTLLMQLSEIQNLVKKELDAFENYFKQQLQSPVPLLATITQQVFRSKGKQLRPLLVFLSAKINGNITPKTYVGASLVELLHSATLMHDDVVDDAEKRRSFLSTKALWNSKTAVLAGDFLLARGMLLAVENKATDFIEIISNAIHLMSEGELQQMERAKYLRQSEEEYFEVIYKKTATLIESCTAIGAYSSNANEQQVQAMRTYGRHLGTAYQLRDDAMDYMVENPLFGKAKGNDVREKKITLPLIFALNKVDKQLQKQILSWVATAKFTPKLAQKTIDFVIQHKGIDHCNIHAQKECDLAKTALNIYPPSVERNALCSLAEYAITRTK